MCNSSTCCHSGGVNSLHVHCHWHGDFGILHKIMSLDQQGLTTLASHRGCGCSGWMGRDSPCPRGLGWSLVLLLLLAPGKVPSLLTKKILQLRACEIQMVMAHKSLCGFIKEKQLIFCVSLTELQLTELHVGELTMGPVPRLSRSSANVWLWICCKIAASFPCLS